MIIERYYSFNKYLREQFGQRVHRISIDAGFNCPNIDGSVGKDGCVFCNNKAFSIFLKEKHSSLLSLEEQLESIKQQIETSIEFYKKRFKVKKFIAYYQSYSNTYADVEILKKKYDVIKGYNEIVGLFISTRTDCIDKEKLKLISGYKSNYLIWLEYGLQTTDDNVLEKINRGHNYNNFLEVLDLTKSYGLNVGVHIILGLPGQDIIKDAKNIAKLPIEGIKFHVLHILRQTALEKKYLNGEIKLLTEQEYIKLLCDFLELIPQKVVILRLVSTAKEEYLIAPKWINNKEKIIKNITKELENRDSFQGKKFF